MFVKTAIVRKGNSHETANFKRKAPQENNQPSAAFGSSALPRRRTCCVAREGYFITLREELQAGRLDSIFPTTAYVVPFHEGFGSVECGIGD